MVTLLLLSLFLVFFWGGVGAAWLFLFLFCFSVNSYMAEEKC